MKPPPPQDVQEVDGYQCQNRSCQNHTLVTVLPVVQLAPGVWKRWTDLECSSCGLYLGQVRVHVVTMDTPPEGARGATT